MKLLEAGHMFQTTLLNVVELEGCQYLRRWNNGLIYWIIMYFLTR